MLKKHQKIVGGIYLTLGLKGMKGWYHWSRHTLHNAWYDESWYDTHIWIVFNLCDFLFDVYCIHFAWVNYDYRYISCLCFGLKTLTRYLFYVCHYLCEVVMFICVFLCTFYSNEMYNNVALYKAFHFWKFVCQMTY